MTREPQTLWLCGIILSTVLSVWSQSASPPSSMFQYKAPSLTRSMQDQVVLKRPENVVGQRLFFYPLINQPEQYPYRQGYTSGSNQYQDTTKLTPQQPFLQQDFSQKTRKLYAGNPEPQSVEVATSNQQPTYYPYHSNQKDSSFGDNAAFAKILNLANVLSRNPRPESSRNYDPMSSASEVQQEICSPPKPDSPQNPPRKTPQLHSSSPTPSPCSQTQPSSNAKPQCSGAKPLQSPTSTPPCPQPKLEAYEPPLPAPKFTQAKNPFQSDSPEQLTRAAFVSVSPLHSSSKHQESSTESPCTTTPCSGKKSYQYDMEQPSKQVVPIVPAAKPVVYTKPFSENENERMVPIPPSPKGVLYHKQHVTENGGDPEGYTSKSEILPQVPYYVYQNVGRNPYGPTMYPYVPPPITKPIPLVMPADSEDDEEDFIDVYYPVKEDSYHIERPSRKYSKDWSMDALRDIADKLGAILDEDFRGRRFSARAYPDNERGYSDDFERYDDESGPYARSYWNNYEEDFVNNRRKERKNPRVG